MVTEGGFVARLVIRTEERFFFSGCSLVGSLFGDSAARFLVLLRGFFALGFGVGGLSDLSGFETFVTGVFATEVFEVSTAFFFSSRHIDKLKIKFENFKPFLLWPRVFRVVTATWSFIVFFGGLTCEKFKLARELGKIVGLIALTFFALPVPSCHRLSVPGFSFPLS